MSREGLVTLLLVGVDGNIVTCRLRPDTVFFKIFSAYAYRAGCAPATTRFYYRNSVVEWDSALADHGFLAEGRVKSPPFAGGGYFAGSP